MADDLRSFLELRPIQARRIGWSQRLVRYTQRHRLLSVLVVLSFILMTALSIGGPLLAIRYSRAAQAEALARDAANKNLDEIKRVLSDSLVDAVGALRDVPGTSELRGRLAQNTYELCQRLLSRSAGDPQIQFRIAHGLNAIAYDIPQSEDALRLQSRFWNA